MSDPVVFSVGLEQDERGATLVHCFSVPGCVAAGRTQEEALDAFADALGEWLLFRASLGEPVPAPDRELEVAVDEWVLSDLPVGPGESHACFEHDRTPLSDEEIAAGLRMLGDLRGSLLRRVRRLPDAEMDRPSPGGWPVRRILDELARAQWWTLTRLGASPLGEVPDRTLGRLDTAMALVVQQFTELVPHVRDRVVELEGEEWTPRKVMRRLLWLEWALGGSALHALGAEAVAR